MSIKELLFHMPWWLGTAIVAIGVILFFLGNSSNEFRVRIAGVIILLVAAIMITVSYLVETDMEKVTRETHELAHAVQQRDWATMKALLDPRATLAGYGNRDQILEGAKRSVDAFGLKSVTILSTDTKKIDTVINVTIKVWTEMDAAAGRTVTSTWQFEWDQQPNGTWSLTTITPLDVGGQGPAEILSHLPAP